MTEARHDYQQDLDLLARKIEVLFGEVENSVQRATTALLEGDRDLAQQTIKHDDLIDELTIAVEEDVIKVIALQAPVATDLRYLLSVLRISSDLERSGDLALRVAKQVFDQSWIARADHLKPFMRRLADASATAFGRAAEAWSARDDSAWEDVEQIDFDVDNEYARILEEVRNLEGPQSGDIAIHCLIAAQALERIADHAVSITQRIRYLVTGEPEGLVGEISPTTGYTQ